MSILQVEGPVELEATRQRNLQRLLNSRSIVVVGASSDPAKAGSQVLKSLCAFPGSLAAVHPLEKEIQGVSCYPSVADLCRMLIEHPEISEAELNRFA
jgi:predicted CoA-binding protein